MIKYHVLKNKDFRNLWLAQAISISGDSFYKWICLYMVDRLSNSLTNLAIFGLVSAIPFMIFGSYAGILADRFDRRKIMFFTDITSAIILISFSTFLYLIKSTSTEIIFIFEFCLSSLFVFFMPARGASVPMLVPQKSLMEANGLSSATQGMMPLIGMGIAGGGLAIIQKFFPNMFFPIGVFINSITFLGSAFFVLKLPKLQPEIIKSLETQEGQRPKNDLKEGFHYIFKHHVLLIFLLMEMFSFLSVSLYIPSYIITNRVWFGGQFSTLTIMETIQVASIVLGSLLVSKMIIKRPSKPYLIATFISGLGFFLMGSSKIFWIFAVFNGIVGISIPFLDVPLTSYIQSAVSNQFLGRVTSLQSMLTYGMLPVGIFIFGPMLEKYGPGPSFMLMGAVRIFGGLIGLSHKRFRTAIMPNDSQE